MTQKGSLTVRDLKWILVGGAAYLSLELVSVGRLLHAAFQQHDVSAVEGVLEVLPLRKMRGELLLISNSSGQWTFSCEAPGLREYAGCFAAPQRFRGKQMVIEWVASPAGVFAGEVRRPVRVRLVGEPGDVWVAKDARAWYLGRARDKGIYVVLTGLFFVGIYAGFRKLFFYFQRGAK